MLSEKQKEYREALEWYYYGARATGRTYLACYVAISHAIETGGWVQVHDHSFPYHEFPRVTMLKVLNNEFVGLHKITLKSFSGIQMFRIDKVEDTSEETEE